MLKLINLGKNFGPLTLFKDLNLEVAQNERFFILGPSGCGKTSLLRIIAGLDGSHQGQIQINEQNISPLPPHKRGVGFVFQDGALWPHITIEKHLTFAPGASHRKDWHDFLLNLTGLESRRKDFPSTLSGGEQQRLALARALSNKPNLLLLDEPLHNLDRNLALEIRESIMEILEQTETTAVFVTHDQEEALSMAHRILLMRKGGPVQIGTPEEVFMHPKNLWAATFFGPVNRFSGTITPEGKILTPIGEFRTDLPPNTACEAVFKASFIEAQATQPGVKAKVLRRIFRGDNLFVQCEVSGDKLLAFSKNHLSQQTGNVYLKVNGDPAVFSTGTPHQ